MLEIAQEQVVHVVGAHGAAHALRCPRHHRLGGRDFRGRRGAMRQRGQHLAARLRSDLDEEAVLVPEQFGQCEVVARLRLRAGLHRDAEAGAAGLAAIDRDDEVPFAPRAVMRIGIGVAHQHAVLDGDGGDLAGAHADEGEARAVLRRRVDAHGVSVARGAPEILDRRVQEFLPGMRADGIAEERLVVAADDTVVSAVLLVGPAFGQVGDRVDIVVDDRLVAQRRPENAVAARLQRGEKGGEPVDGQCDGLVSLHRAKPRSCAASLGARQRWDGGRAT